MANQLSTDMRKLSNALLEGDHLLFAAEATLDRALSSLPSSTLSADVTQLMASLNRHRRVYTERVWASREYAGKTEAMLKDFTDEFLPFLNDPHTPADAAADEIGSYLMMIRSNQYRTDDGNVKESVASFRSFIDDLQHALEKERSLASVDHEIKPIKDKITESQANLSNLAKTAENSFPSSVSAVVTSLLTMPYINSDLSSLMAETGLNPEKLSAGDLSRLQEYKTIITIAMADLGKVQVSPGLPAAYVLAEAAWSYVQVLPETYNLFNAGTQTVIDTLTLVQRQAQAGKIGQQMDADVSDAVQTCEKLIPALASALHTYQMTVSLPH